VIRKGTDADLERAVELLRDSREGAGFDDPSGLTGFTFQFVREYAERLFFNHLIDPKAFCCIYQPKERPEGILLASWFEHPFGPVNFAKETLWWIDPAHRGRGAIRMLDAYEAWADDKGCHFVSMAGMGADPDVSRLYERRGYRVAETHYLKPLKV
jgi:GNAT superfamily N-acetyltransferase